MKTWAIMYPTSPGKETVVIRCVVEGVLDEIVDPSEVLDGIDDRRKDDGAIWDPSGLGPEDGLFRGQLAAGVPKVRWREREPRDG